MLNRLLPLGIKVNFEDRPYKLGETVTLTLELSPRREIEVKEVVWTWCVTCATRRSLPLLTLFASRAKNLPSRRYYTALRLA